MKEKKLKETINGKNNGVSVANSQLNQQPIILGELKGQKWKSNLNLNDLEKNPKLITLKGITTSRIEQALKAKSSYPARVFLKQQRIGKCRGLHCEKKEVELIGYCWLNTQTIDTEKGTVWPSGEKEKLEFCQDCYLYNKPLMEESMKRKKKKNPTFIPYQWFWKYEDIPIFFRIKEKDNWIRPKIKKGSVLQVEGHFSAPTNLERKSFTAYFYQVIEQQTSQILESYGK